MSARNELATESSERELIITRIFDAPRSLVFKVWTQPEHLARWFGPKNFTLPFCEMDFRPGGSYRFCMRSPEGIDCWVWGKYREIVEPERMVFTWNREDENGNLWSKTVVTVTFAEHEGKTKFTLYQALFEKVEYRDEHNVGWSECVERLMNYVEHANK
ncbi:MAG: polyketide cyclase [Pedosphaera sp.]|nr:polyketide cyclase [Pedosphaera sp.]